MNNKTSYVAMMVGKDATVETDGGKTEGIIYSMNNEGYIVIKKNDGKVEYIPIDKVKKVTPSADFRLPPIPPSDEDL